MYSNQPSDHIDGVLDGIDRGKLIQVFSILGIPVGAQDMNSRGEVLEDFAAEDANNPTYWNDRKTAPQRAMTEPLWDLTLHEDPRYSTVRVPKTDWDLDDQVPNAQLY